MNFNRKQINGTFIIFLIIAVTYAVCNFIWWILNTPIIPTWNSAVHFNNILEKGYIFYNAPLITWIMKVMFFIFGKEHYDLTVIFVNYVFFLIPLYFIYKIGVELKDKETGNIAMVLFALVPAVYGMSREYGHQDYHIIAGITFNIYCLIKTDYFRNRKWTIWYGISVGLGLMIKDAFLAYFFVPFIYIVIMGLKEKADRAKAINICISVILGSLIAGWHYFRWDIIHKIINEPVKETLPIFEFDSLRVTTIGLWEDSLSPPIFIIFVIGLIYFILKYKGKYKNIILLWFFVPWLTIMLMPHHKLPEYGAGFIPAMILIGAVFISYINKSYVKKTVILFLIVIGTLQYIDFSYNLQKIKFFYFQFKYNNNKIYYFRYKEWRYYNTAKTIAIFNFIKYLKNNYKGNTFLINNFSYVEKDGLIALMTLNGLNWAAYDNKKLLLYDIVISFPLIYKKNINGKFYNLKTTGIEKFLKDNNYYAINTFYLGAYMNEYSKVTLFGRKDKFLQFCREYFL